MNNREYWEDIDSRLEELLDTGYVKLPSLANFDPVSYTHLRAHETG